MKKHLLLLSCVVSFLGFSAASYSEDTKPVGSGPNPFVDCGIGAALFPSTHWAAVSSNVIWDVGTTALTSATASPETCSGKTMEAAIFINDTYESLVEEVAKGEGENVTALLNILDCSSNQHGVTTSVIRSSLGDVVASPAYNETSVHERASNLYMIIDTAVSDTCAS